MLEFPGPVELSRILEEVGFAEVRFRALTFGISMLHLASRPPAVPDTTET